MGWSAILQEYRRFSWPLVGPMSRRGIESRSGNRCTYAECATVLVIIRVVRLAEILENLHGEVK
jgi:hypothetical protein